MRMLLEDVSNPDSAGKGFQGAKLDFSYSGNNFYFGSLYSSTVKNITREDDTVTVVTRNTTYVFKDID